uniref:Uncharacterized protein n=1 Tax=Arundo donax TaxID=35708 RepID=A0A0A9G7R7_ARUDO
MLMIILRYIFDALAFLFCKWPHLKFFIGSLRPYTGLYHCAYFVP